MQEMTVPHNVECTYTFIIIIGSLRLYNYIILMIPIHDIIICIR